MTYSQLTAEIEVAKTLPEYKIEQDDTKVINQKIVLLGANSYTFKVDFLK